MPHPWSLSNFLSQEHDTELVEAGLTREDRCSRPIARTLLVPQTSEVITGSRSFIRSPEAVATRRRVYSQ